MISLSSADRRTSLGGLLLDVTLTEEVRFASEVSQYPVEDGTIISDHITQGSETVRIMGTMATQDVFAYEADSEGRAKAIDIVEQLRRMHAAREVLNVSTGQLVYTGFAFTDLTATRTADADGGNWLSISAELTLVRKVELRTAEVPDEQRVADTDGAKGRAGQTNKPAGKGTSTSSSTAANANSTGRGTTLLGAGDNATGPAGSRASDAIRSGNPTGAIGRIRQALPF